MQFRAEDEVEFEHLLDWRRLERRARLWHFVESALLAVARCEVGWAWRCHEIPAPDLPER
ncbi:MAG TPA: hypothetical protein VJM33_11445 [Microthrixaceae bacterium]|nr:hypothetical protein [Microthrixaceae bacterium]